MVIILLFISLLFSAALAIYTLTKTQKKWVALFVAFGGNTILLAGTTWIIYIYNEEFRLFGFGHSSLYVLPLFIPVITWINYFILELIKKFSK